MNPELQKFIDKEKQENNGIDTKDIQELNGLLYTHTKELSEEAKNVLTPENSNIMANQIQNFLRSDNGKKIDATAQQHYINILDTLYNLHKNVNLKKTIDEIKQSINEVKMSDTLTTLLGDQVTDSKGNAIKFLDEKTMSDMITNFVTQYNHNNLDNPITTKLFGPEELYNLPNEQKDALASKLAQVLVRKEQNEGKRNQATQQQIQDAIRTYRQEFFTKSFKDGEILPMLLDQKTILLGDRKGVTKGIYKNDTADVGDDTERRKNNIGGFSYERESFRASNTIDRKPGQDTMDIAMLADGVDVGGVDFTIKIDDTTTLQGYTKGIFPDKASRDRYMTMSPSQKEQYRKTLPKESLNNANMIVWTNPEQVPAGVSIKNGGIQIDAQQLGKQPRVSVDVTSPEKNDETFVTISTNGRMSKPGEIAGAQPIMQQNLFENGLHDIKESESVVLNQTINDIKELINKNQVSQQGILRINVESTTDKNQIVETLHTKLKQDLVGLKDSFLKTLEAKYGKELGGQKFNEIQSAIALKVKDRNDSDGNKVLSQCRAYQGMQYIVNNIGDEYLNKISFNIKNIQGDQPKRSFSLYALGETIKQSTKKVSSPLQ